jgi:hypothetical protein
MTNHQWLFAGVIATTMSAAGCAPSPAVYPPQMYHSEDYVQQYTQRSDKVTLSAGDDQAVNTRIHTRDPWPPYVADRRIPANGERMAGAVERYRDVSKLKNAPKPLDVQGTSTSSGGGGSSGGQ